MYFFRWFEPNTNKYILNLKNAKKVKKEIHTTKKQKQNKLKKIKEQNSDTQCLICEDWYCQSKPSEIWVQCRACKKWAHESCIGAHSSKGYKCNLCD